VGIYQFTSEFLLRLIGQYDQFNNKIDIYPLLSLQAEPVHHILRGLDVQPDGLRFPFGTKQTVRQYFLKLQYLLRT